MKWKTCQDVCFGKEKLSFSHARCIVRMKVLTTPSLHIDITTPRLQIRLEVTAVYALYWLLLLVCFGGRGQNFRRFSEFRKASDPIQKAPDNPTIFGPHTTLVACFDMYPYHRVKYNKYIDVTLLIRKYTLSDYLYRRRQRRRPRSRQCGRTRVTISC